MKLATFTAGAAAEIGIVQEKGLLPLSRLAPQIAPDMTTLIAHWDAVQAEVARIAAAGGDHLALSAVHLEAPIARPGKILAIGMNFRDHIEEGKMELPEKQIWFSKQSTCANGPYDDIPVPPVSNSVDYESEMVAVIGKGGRYISKENAAAAVFGYCCGNDVSARDWQSMTTQWMLGKSFDKHAPFGPWITTADEIDNPHDLTIKCFVNGVPHQNASTDLMVFNVWDQISCLSQVMTLEAGDIVFTGTPGAIGAGRRPRPFLKDGDVVRIEIDKLGHIENTCRNEVL